MSFISATKNKISNYILNRKLHRKNLRQKEFYNLESARTVGILFDTNEEKNHKIIKSFTKKLNNYDLKPEVLGWIDSAELPNYAIGRQIIYYCNKDINFLGRPRVLEISNFINKKFDLLFDLSESSHPNIRHIAVSSKASCKVGRYGENKSHLDVIIKPKDEVSLEELIDESILCLTQIKKEQSND